MKILIAVIIFSAIILFHEFGHFLFAKLNGIGVTEFSLGMGPRLFSFQKGETRYSLKLLPIGGSCAMVGEDTDEEELPGSFNAASVGGRISVVAAGPVFKWHRGYRVFSGNGTETFQFSERGNSLFSEITSDRWLLCNGR